MPVREPLLTIHVLSVIVWLGCGLYELFLARDLKRARGTPLELHLMRLYLRYSAPVPIATLLVAATGVLMAVFVGWGFFQHLWLGTKQAIMLIVLAIFASVVPPFLRLKAQVEALPPDAVQLPADAARIFDRLEPWLVVMRVLGATAVVLAVFKPGPG